MCLQINNTIIGDKLGAKTSYWKYVVNKCQLKIQCTLYKLM